MKIVFVSNYYNHHQKPFCDALYNTKGIDFHFITTTSMRDERKKMGYDKIEIPSYVVRGDLSKEELEKGKELINEADAAICGFVSKDLLKRRIKSGKIVFYYTERPFKTKLSFKNMIKTKINWRLRINSKKDIYLLSASSYAPYDFKELGVFINKTFKWGYFPETKKHDISLMQRKENTILWCGRFLKWKCPMDALMACKNLFDDGYDFKLKFIGNGEEQESLKAYISENSMQDKVEIIDFMPPEKVRFEMEKSSIFLFTSNKQEGWGAVLNEAMNSGCAIIASHAAGSSKYLIEDGENGFIYESGNLEMLTQKLKLLLDSPEKIKRLGTNAYTSISEVWNAENAAKRFIILAKTIINGNKHPDLFPDGPCSIASPISDNFQ